MHKVLAWSVQTAILLHPFPIVAPRALEGGVAPLDALLFKMHLTPARKPAEATS